MLTKFCSENMKGRERGRPRRMWEDNIKMGLSEIGWEVLDFGSM
jgi:hypothetical protein